MQQDRIWAIEMEQQTNMNSQVRKVFSGLSHDLLDSGCGSDESLPRLLDLGGRRKRDEGSLQVRLAVWLQYRVGSAVGGNSSCCRADLVHIGLKWKTATRRLEAKASISQIGHICYNHLGDRS